MLALESISSWAHSADNEISLFWRQISWTSIMLTKNATSRIIPTQSGDYPVFQRCTPDGVSFTQVIQSGDVSISPDANHSCIYRCIHSPDNEISPFLVQISWTRIMMTKTASLKIACTRSGDMRIHNLIGRWHEKGYIAQYWEIKHQALFFTWIIIII